MMRKVNLMTLMKRNLFIKMNFKMIPSKTNLNKTVKQNVADQKRLKHLKQSMTDHLVKRLNLLKQSVAEVDHLVKKLKPLNKLSF